MIEHYSQILEQERDRLNVLLGEKNKIEKDIKECVDDILEHENKEYLLSSAQAVFERLLDEGQAKVLRMIEGVATAALTEVFGEPISLHCVVELKRGVQCLEMEVEIAGKRRDPKLAMGGGVADVLGLILQLLSVKMTNGVADTLFLDEPLRNLSVSYRARVGVMVERLCESLGIQLVQITHSLDLTIGNKWNLD